MSAALAALLALAACSARADVFRNDDVPVKTFVRNGRSGNALGSPDLPPGCLYEGRWYVEGASVRAREPCLRCACAGGALSCARRACAPLPDPPPQRCHVLHRRDACCPELHCPDGVHTMEHSASARLDHDEFFDVATPASVGHACVEGGVVFSAGSALASRVACETCFCLGGSRRCVRPRCLPAPPACRARPAPGACCPQRYYCDAPSTPQPPHSHRRHDCEANGTSVAEGERVLLAEGNCTQCFCLRGGVRCQRLACAPPLLGCTPLVRDGQCCPHQYRCDQESLLPRLPLVSGNSLSATRYDDRSFHAAKTSRLASSTRNTSTDRNTPTHKNQTAATIKVKRKTSDLAPVTVSHEPAHNITKSTSAVIKVTPNPTTTTTANLDEYSTEPKQDVEKSTAPQPEGSVRVIINGTINCTAELTSSPTNTTAMNYTDKIQLEAQPRVPFLSGIIDAVTSDPNDIITDRNAQGSFNEKDTFTINVTSSLSHTTTPASQSTVGNVLPPVLEDALNISAKTKEDYDYDYTVPTLPPSLPNLKIIPFVAADAVVDDEPSKDTYSSLEREDKFPVYYPTVESKDTPIASPIATRREDAYLPSQYPVYIDKNESGKYPSLAHELDQINTDNSGLNNLASILHEYTVSTSLGTHVSEASKVTKSPIKTTSLIVETPAVNLFSPPAETEGGFIPKGPGIINEYYAVYPSTPPGPPPAPHLTTSMQIDVAKGGECVSSDGRHVPEGDSISMACSVCTCGWSELHCVPRPCFTPPGCRRRPATSSSGDLCCGELLCKKDNKSSISPLAITLNEGKMPAEIKSEIIPFDPPPDRAVPEETSTYRVAVTESLTEENSIAKDVNKTTDVTIQATTTVANFLNTNNNNSEKVLHATTTTKPTPANSTETLSTMWKAPTTTTPPHKEVNETNSQSQEYEDEEEEDGFSFGSVLKLLLSDSYDATTPAAKRKLTTTMAKSSTATSSTPTSSTPTTMIPPTRRLSPKPTVAPFIPMPHHPYVPPKKVLPPNTVNRIDHLVLGEATAIKKSTSRPITSLRPMTTFKHFARTSTRRPATTTPMKVTKEDDLSVQYTSVTHDGSQPQGGGSLSGVGGLLKLAGCNIYGRMYRVGRIIAELSTPCQECRCTELGVQCRALSC